MKRRAWSFVLPLALAIACQAAGRTPVSCIGLFDAEGAVNNLIRQYTSLKTRMDLAEWMNGINHVLAKRRDVSNSAVRSAWIHAQLTRLQGRTALDDNSNTNAMYLKNLGERIVISAAVRELELLKNLSSSERLAQAQGMIARYREQLDRMQFWGHPENELTVKILNAHGDIGDISEREIDQLASAMKRQARLEIEAQTLRRRINTVEDYLANTN